MRKAFLGNEELACVMRFGVGASEGSNCQTVVGFGEVPILISMGGW